MVARPATVTATARRLAPGVPALLAFGLRVHCSFDLHPIALHATTDAGDPPAAVMGARLTDITTAAAAFSGSLPNPAVRRAHLQDGSVWRIERGRDGDHSMVWAEHATFHLDAAGHEMLCGPVSPRDPGWRRVFLDSALTTASLVHGFEALHGAAVATPAGALVVCAEAGGGKSTLCAELLRRGHDLVADDILALDRGAHGVRAHPGPPVISLPAACAAPRGATPLARFAGETWLAIGDSALGPVPLAAVVLLERRPGADLGLNTVRDPLPALLTHALDSGRAPERRSRRFHLLADLAERVPIRRLTADPGVAPSALADVILEA